MLAVDCQGLAGSFTYGTGQAGFDVVAKLELPGAFGLDNVRQNEDLIRGDRLSSMEFQVGPWEEWEPYDVDYVFGNPPCSGFSLMNTSAVQARTKGTKTRNHRGANSPINDCMWALASYAGRVAPAYVAMESVQQAYSQGRELMQQLRAKVQELTNLEYRLTHVKLSGSSLGNPQMRHRYYMVLSRQDVAPFKAIPPEPREPYTYRDAFEDLQGLDVTWDAQHYALKPTSPYHEEMRNGQTTVTDHVTRGLEYASKHCSQVDALIDEWEPGDDLKETLWKWYQRHGSIPEPPFDLARLEERDWKMGFQQPRRIRWDQKGYVVTGAGGMDFIHPEERRFLTVRECARLQGFPDAWDWSAATVPQQAYAWIGKGVPSQCGRWVSDNVATALQDKHDDEYREGELIGDDEYLIDITYAWKGRHNL